MQTNEIFDEGTYFTPTFPVPYSDDDSLGKAPSLNDVGKWVTISSSKFWNPEEQNEFLGVYEKTLPKGEIVMDGVELQSDCIVATEIITNSDGEYILGGRRYIPVTYQIRALNEVLFPSQTFHIRYTGKTKTNKGRIVKTFEIRVYQK